MRPRLVTAIRSALGSLAAVLATSLALHGQTARAGDEARVEGTLRVELDGRRVEIHNDSDRVRTPRASLVLGRCWEIADRLVPWPR